MPLLSRSDYLYQIRIYDNSNNLLGVYDDLISLQYRKVVNEPGMAVLTVPDDHPIISQLVDDLLMEVYFIYRPATTGEVTDQQDFLGLYRDKQIVTDQDGNIHYLLLFPSAIEALSRDVIAYPSGVTSKSRWVGQTMANIAADIVTWNCTSSATTANGRHRTANPVRSMAVTAVAGTPTIDYSVSYRNVLEVVQELAAGGNFDFDVIRNGATTNLKFQEYTLLGTDKSAIIIFDLNLDNVQGAAQNGERLKEKTVAIVGGDGAGASRNISIRTGANQSASNDYEIFIDARSNSPAELVAIGDTKMLELQARTSVDIDFASSSGYVYRRDYGLGDWVTVSFGGVMQTKKIALVEVTFDQSQVTNVRLEFTNP